MITNNVPTTVNVTLFPRYHMKKPLHLQPEVATIYKMILNFLVFLSIIQLIIIGVSLTSTDNLLLKIIINNSFITIMSLGSMYGFIEYYIINNFSIKEKNYIELSKNINLNLQKFSFIFVMILVIFIKIYFMIKI